MTIPKEATTMSDNPTTGNVQRYAGVHIGAMFLMGILSIVSISGLISGQIFPEDTTHQLQTQFQNTIMMGIVVLSVDTVALLSGILYVFHGYMKRAALLYRIFLVLSAVSCAASAAASTMRYLEEFPSENKVLQIILMAILPMAVKTGVLLVLAFGKNLGKQRSYILFAVLLGIDILYSLLWFSPGEIAMVRITLALTRLTMTSTIGLALRGKYADKDERGTT